MSDSSGSSSHVADYSDPDELSDFSPPNIRPSKRRRLSTEREGQGQDSDYGEEGDSQFLPHPPKTIPRGHKATENNGPKRRIHQPKYYTNQEPIFVTQLTQPPSSPSAIRGPRWQKPRAPAPQIQKPVASIFTPRPGPKPIEPVDKGYGSDEEIKAAIVASLQSFKEENLMPPPSVTKQKSPKVIENDGDGGGGYEDTGLDFDLDDLPEEVFDLDPDTIAPNPPTTNGSSFSSSHLAPQSSFQRLPSSQQGSFRQTTLFGGIAPNRQTSSQSSSRAWPLANQNEPPTHHELDPEAIKSWVFPMNLGRKREYQFNITQRGLLHNVLVALPTGLGKTFIAATIMLNWFRWTKNAQIVFVAPTRPLVSQQVGACYDIAGIPRSQTTMLTGNVQPALRAKEWESKRVFFMTPQTLINDLKHGYADPKRIVLLVVDEAHRATGAYVYVEVVKFIQRFSSSFRVLALTATPGSTVETVQEVIDGLNISRVEIRTEQSLDIRDYIHDRNVDTVSLTNSDDMEEVMKLFSKALQPAVDKLRNLNAYWAADPTTLTPFGLTEARKKWMLSPAGRNSNWGLKGMVNSIFSTLASLAHAMELLKYHGIGPFFRNLSSFNSSLTEAGGKGGKYARQIADDGNFKLLMNKLRSWTNDEDFIGHPKLEYLKRVVLNHFLDADGDRGASHGAAASGTRVMIFSHFRDSAEEIVRVLKKHAPIILPHVFVGQASAKGSDGMDQKTQLDIIQKFKAGTYNTIVATSIGEEGLDIGEVDLIVCYDSSASPIRMLQRMGRTGRKRSGNVTLLLMKGKEEDKYLRAKDNYEKMQQIIASGDRFTFHDDKSPRIIPREIQPQVDEREIEIPVENSQAGLPEPTKSRRVPKKPPKKFHMPDDVETGFTKASTLGGGKKVGKKARDSQSKSKRGERVSRSPELAEIPPLSEVLLTSSQERELKQKYQTVAGISPQIVTLPRNDVYPSLQRSYRPTRIIRHGRTTRRMVKTLRKMAAFGSDCESQYKDHLRPQDIELVNDRRHDSREQSPVPEKQNPSSRSSTSMKSKRHREVSPAYSSLMCTQDTAVASPERIPPFASQMSLNDSDFPDLETIIAESFAAPIPPSDKKGGEMEDIAPRATARKRRRHIVTDDSDMSV